MTFEEKYAAQGRKLDELKAKLDASIDARKIAREKKLEEIAADIDALDAKIDAFNASVDTKLDAKADELDAKLDAKLDAQADKIGAGMDSAEAKLEAGAAKAKAAMTLDKADAESIANEKTGVDAIQKQTAGDFAVAEENARMIRERRDAKCSNAKLRTELKVNAAKEKIAVRKEELDKAAQEDWILDLLDYANSCYEMAYAWALEAEYTMMEAAYEIDYYTKRFGPDEEKK